MLPAGKEGYEPETSAKAQQASSEQYNGFRPVPVTNATQVTDDATPVASEASSALHPVPVNTIPVATAVEYRQNYPVQAVLVQSTMVRGDQGWYDGTPRRILCQFCGHEVITSVRRTPGAGTHLWALLLLCIGCWPCCLVPYCVDDCQDAIHICPNCRRPVGEKRFM